MFFILAVMLTSVTAHAQNEVYTSFDQSTGTLTYFFDDQREARQAAGQITEVYDPVYSPNTVRFKEYDTQVTKAVIDPSMKDAHLSSTFKMFYGGYDQKSYKLSNMTEIVGMENLVTDEVWSMSCMFQFCTKLTTIDLSSFNTDNVTDMWGMFYLCYGLTSLDVSKFNTENVYDMGYMFSNCDALTSLDLSNFNIASVTNMESMFAYNSSLTTIICNGKWSESLTLNNSTDMFSGCISLVGGMGTTCDGENNTNAAYAHPDGGEGNPGYFTSNEDPGVDPGDCESEGIEVYTEYNAATKTLTYYYDDQRCSRTGKTEVYDPDALRFEGYYDQIQKAVIDPSMQNAHLTSTVYMFFGGWGETEHKLSAMTEIEGIDNLVTDAVKDMHGMFDYCSALTSLDLGSFNTANVTDMRFMFCGCSSLSSLNVRSFNTAKVTNMSSMFDGCSSLTELNLGSFSTARVTNMGSMFSMCSSLTSLDLSGFDTQNVTDMRAMFFACEHLASLNIKNFNTSKVKSMRQMFLQCPFKSLDVSSFRTGNVTDMKGMFSQCYELTELNLSTFNTSNVTDMNNMFYLCNHLTSLDLRSFNTEKVTDMSEMFRSCSRLVSLDISSFRTGDVTNMNDMFSGCSSLTELDLSAFNISNVTKMDYMFNGCSSLTELDLKKFSIDKVWSMLSMFQGCSALQKIYCNHDWSKSTVLVYSDNIFKACTSLEGGMGTKCDGENNIGKSYARPDEGSSNPGYFRREKPKVYTEFDAATKTLTYYYDDLRSAREGVIEIYDPVNDPEALRFTSYHDQVLKVKIDESMKDARLTSMHFMFFGGIDKTGGTNAYYGLSNATAIEGMENLVTDKVTDMSNMFDLCSSLTSIDLSHFNTLKVDNIGSMFNECSSLTSLDLSKFNTSNVTSMFGVFYGCSSLTELDLSMFNTDKVTSMSFMFAGCSSITVLDLSAFNTANVTITRQMFEGCTALKTILCDEDWSQSAVLAYSDNMFKGCTSLVGNKGTTCDGVNHIDNTYARPDKGGNDPGYFTGKEVYTEFDAETGTLTYYYDLKRLTRTGITEIYDPVNNPDAVRFKDYHDQVLKAVIDESMKNAGLESMYRMFNGRYDNSGYSQLQNMTKISGMENLVTDDVTDMSYMFCGCRSLTSLNLTSFNTENVESMIEMFSGCRSLTLLDISSFNTAKVKNMSSMFWSCSSLTSLDLSNFNPDNVLDMYAIFRDCSSLTSLDLSSFNTSNVTNMSSMFHECTALTSLDLNAFNIAKVTHMTAMFLGCRALKTILCNDDWSKSEVLTNSSNMFSGCTSLVGGKGTTYDADHVDATYAHPDGGTKQPGYFFEQKAEVYTEFDATSGTLTYYYDDQRYTRKGITEVYDPVNNPDAVRFKDYHDQVLKAVIDESMKNAGLESMYRMFNGRYDNSGYSQLQNMTKISGMENLVTDDVTDMSYMFCGCRSLTSLNLTSFNTENVESMIEMFSGCRSLTLLDISSFNTAKVKNMSSMFWSCSSLTSLDLSNFNPDNVLDMYAIFRDCSSLTSLDLSSFNTSNVTNMSSMFHECTALTSLDLNAFNIAKVTHMTAMFLGCRALKTILCNDDWSKSEVLTNSSNMFSGCTSLVGGKGTTYDADHVDATYAHPDEGKSNPGYFFKKKTEVYTEFDATTGILTYYYDDQRYTRKGITEVYDPKNNPNAIRFKDYHDQVLKAVIDKSMKNAGLTSMCNMFSGWYEKIDNNIQPYYLSALTEISDIENLVTDEVTDMSYMFHTCSALTSLNLTSFNTANVKNMHGMFSSCSALTSLNLTSFNTTNVTDMGSMFYKCSALTSLDLSSKFNTTNVRYMSSMFHYCSSLTSLDLSSFNTANVTGMSSMFYECTALTSLDFSKFNTDKVTSMYYMFYRCKALKTILCNDDWSKSKVLTESEYMFSGCTSLVGGNGTKYDAYHTGIDYAHPDGEDGKPGYFTSSTQLKPLPDDETTTFDFSLYDPAGSELLGVTLGAKDQYNATEGRIEISTTNTEEEIDEKLNAAFAGAASLKSLLPGTITFKLKAGKGEITIDCKTVPGYVLKVRIAEYGTAYISATIEQALRGEATVTYDVTQDTYVVIYLEGAPSGSKSPARLATSDDDKDAGAYIYSITITPKDVPTAIEETSTVNDSLSTEKVLKDGVLYIHRADKVYSIDGRLVK